MRPADRPLRVLDREDDLTGGIAQDAAVADLAAALGVERASGRGRAPPSAPASMRSSTSPRASSSSYSVPSRTMATHASRRARRLVAQERGVADAPGDAAVEGRELRLARQVLPCVPERLRSRCCRRAASKPSRSTRTPYSAASSTVRSMGKP